MRHLPLVFCLLFSSAILAQKTDTISACNPDNIFMIVDEMPSYKGGWDTLEIDLNQVVSIDEEVEGKVYTKLVINCNSQVASADVYRGISPEVDQKIMDGLLELQNWNSAKHLGRKLDCYYNVIFEVKKNHLHVLNEE